MRIILVIPTYYNVQDDTRYSLALDTCREILRCSSNRNQKLNNKDGHNHSLEAIIVDASPEESIRESLRLKNEADESYLSSNNTADTTSSINSIITVVQQTSAGKKGAALREGIALAAQRLLSGSSEDINNDAMICFQEPEKVNMVQHWLDIASLLSSQSSSCICVPRRSPQSFQSTYPMEQYHAEMFANMYLDSLVASSSAPLTLTSIDWTMGPIAFHAPLVQYWLDYTQGDLWDMQLVPIIHAAAAAGGSRQHKIIEYQIDYEHPQVMKQEEEHSPIWSEKRLFQLNFLFDTVGRALKKLGEGKNLDDNN